jgi:hypothetical protein
MNQALYAHMNNKRKMKKKNKELVTVELQKKKRTFLNAIMYPHPAQQLKKIS